MKNRTPLLPLLALLALLCTPFALRADTLYVTPTGAGAKDGSSWANAFAGIQAAVDYVDAAVAADANYAIPVIRVADGTYSRVSMTNDLALDVRSVNGAASTVIDGGGTNNCVDVRLSGWTNFGQSPKFTGFTLRNGDVHALVYDRGGGAAGGSLFDCIIEDCVAWMGGGTYNANTMRCVIRRNRTTTYYGGAVYGGSHVNDLIVENNGYYAVIANASLYSSTVADNTARSNYYYFLNDSTARNCILWGNTVNGEACPQDDPSDPKFVGGGDYHLRAGSPALNDGLEDWQTEAYVGLTDLDGNARVQGAKIDRGCYEAENGQGIVGVLVLASAEGNGTVSPAHSFVNVGATVTITADTSTWHRDVTAWYTNGVPAAGVALPAGLRPLEYVESTGDQYVDTGIATISGTTAFDYVFENLQTGTTWKGLVGARNGTTSYGSQAYNVLVRGGEVRLDTVGQSTRVSTTGTNTLSYTAAATVFNGTSYANAGKAALGVPLMLFTFGTSADGGHYAPSAQRLFSCSISEGGVLVRDFVPVADANGVAGLYDRVSETVFYSATATPLVAGPEKSSAGNTLTFTATGEQIDVVAQFATLDWFVNGTTGSDTANNGRTASTAFKTIQHAIDCAAPEETIFVAAGTYAPIDASRANVAIIGDGRDTTIIDGGGTTRCADLGERNFSYLQGFTLRNGRHMNVGTTPGQGEEGTGGGGVKGGFLIDCAIENCHSTFGGGAFHSEIHRSIIRDCSAYEGGGAIFGEYFNCLFDRNWATQGGAASSASLWGCTVVRSRAVDFAAVYVSSAYSCIFWGNKSGNGRTNYWLLEEGECCFEEEMEEYNVSFTGDPLFVDPENGDFRLREDSPCIDCGWDGVLEDEFDVRGAGYPRRIDALGGEEIADMGCYEGGVPLSQIPQPPTPPTPRTIQVSGGGAALQNAVAAAKDGDTLVVANGTYSAIDARGKVLTIVSENGPAAAIIRGSSTTRAATLSTSMTHPASTLAGFTVEGGTSTDLLYGGGGILGGYVSNCVVRGNSAYCGGGVALAYVTHSIISNNTATVSGGGACASWLDTCLVVHNAANVNLAGFDLTPWGGGVPAANDNESGGGGIAFSAANFCTITRNTSTTYAGGGMFVVLDNTYVAGNTAAGGPAGYQNADLFPQYPNHVCATSPNFNDDEGFVNATEDDSLVDPDNGDYRLKATSLCVEGGDTAFISHRHATDLDGNPRWRGSAPDIGCYEAAGATPLVVPDVDAWTGPVWEGDEGVFVEWGVSRGAEWYTIHRSTADDFATATQIGRVDAPVTEFFDATAEISVRYRYWVVAHSTVGDGPVGTSVEGYWVPELVITTPYLPNGLTRELYSTNLTATGGMPPYTWTVETPSWLSVSGSTISGMPRKAGDTTVTVSVEDADGQVDIRSWTLAIENNPAPFGPATPYAGEAYPGNYLIRNFDELRLFEETLRDPGGFDFEGATFTLVNDIDCGGRAFAPTNGACSYFNGTFDGQGHVISNYVNHGHSTGSLLGDAGYGAVVKDVTLVGDIRLTTLWDRWGTTALSENSGAAAFAEFVQAGPAADAPPGLTMLNCHFVGTVTNAQTGDSGLAAGGLVAYVSKQGGFDASPVGTVNLRMSNCTVRAFVDGREGAGGLVGGGFGIEAADCSVTGGVYRASNVGGLGGFIRRSSFTDCTFDGEIDSIPVNKPAEGGGGLVGAARGVTLRRCAARARVCWEYPTLHDDDHTFTACGGAIGVSWDDTACYDCSFEGSIQSKRGFFGGFIGWADSAEVFSNCHVRATYAPDGLSIRDATGGFAGVVSSDGARFVDCSAESLGGGASIDAGFFSSQQPVVQNISGIPYTVGTNSFLRCSAKNMTAYNAGFCSSAWNCSFRGCSVRGVASNGAGFVGNAGDPPGDGYLYAQNSLFEDCSVVSARANYGFAEYANHLSKNGSTNVFRRCRASGTFNNGFGTLGKGSTAEDCAVVGLSAGSFGAGFAGSISTGATVRRCVGALMPLPSETFGAGFADSIGYDSVVEDCYSVYAPTAAAIYDRQEGGFVRSTTLGISSSSATSSGLDKIARCFTLGAIPATGRNYIGSFCGGTPEYPYGATYDVRFEDCYRPAESPVGDFSNQDHAGVAAFTRAEFANANAATMPNYDFEHVWRAPGGDASSPYLKASTDENGNFWFYAEPPSGTGFILVNDEAPREAYPAGARIKVKAVGNGLPFTGWIGEGFDDPTAQETWYTVRNVSAIGATFGTPIYTVDDFTNLLSSASTTSKITGNYVLMNDLDFSGVVWPSGYASSVSVYDFQGKFFGQGYTISGLCTTNGDFSTTFALFSKVSAGAEIRDLTVELSNVPGDRNTLSLAGLAASVGSGVTISNCHAVVDWQGVYPAIYDNYGYGSCLYYGLARTVSGTDIHIVDCTVRGRLAGGTQACGFVGSATLTGGEIARCAVFADVSTLTNRTDGSAAGFAGSITLEGGAVVRECLSAGVVDAERDAFGFAGTIDFRDAASSFRDCYSTAEVVSHHPGYYNSYGIAQSISGYYEGNATIENVWFGGAVRGGRENRSFARSVSYANLVNCRSVTVADAPASGTAGVTALSPAAARQSASWTGYDFGNVWSMTDGSTTPYFAWSLTTNGAFRVFADEDPGTTIAHPYDAAPGAAAAISAAAEDPDLFFCQWAGAAAYTNAAVNPSAFLADNHRTVRCVWGKAITTRAELEAVANDPAGVYALGCDIDLGGEPWTPLCQDEYTPFSGTLYGNGHTISNLIVDTDGAACAGLFGRLQNGATVVDLNLANPVVRGANCVGTLAGYVDGANIAGCTVVGADVTATSERAGCFVGQIYGAASSVSRCSVVGEIAGSGRYVGGFVGSAEGSASIEKCYALGSVKGTGGEGFGGFVGYTAGNSVSFSECFACGAVAASGRNSVGGFAGYVGSSPAISDCYALADVTGGSYVGGFAGQISYCEGTFTRCYSAGATAGSSDVGGFVGRNYSSSYNPTYANCFRIDDGLADVGASDIAGIDAIGAADFLDADNFAAWTAPGGKWSQTDGKTQPYFAWGLVDGKMTLTGTTAGTGRGAVRFYDGDGNEGTAFEPGETVTLVAEPDGSVFLEWLGNASYADRSDYATTMPLDNFRIVTAQFGKLITNRTELEKIADDPTGSYALGANIDLSGEDWTPIGNSSTPFTGSLYGGGYSITGLKFENTTSGEAAGTHAGLFRYAKDATFVGIVLEDVDLDGYQYVGALAGEVQGATTVRDCSASGTAKSSNGCVGMLVGRVYNANGTVFEGCEAAGEVVSGGASAGGLVGDISNSTVSFEDCGTDVAVSGTGGNNKGGLVGYIESSGSASFLDCWTEGDVSASNSDYVGGFIGYASRPVFCDNCQTFGATSGKSYTGGFAGQASGEGSVFADCVANGGVTTANGSQAGGFVGSASGARSRYEGCTAYGVVAAGSGSQVGGFVGQSSAAGVVFADCLARGAAVRTTGSAVGGFAGKSSSSNEFTRCQAKALAVSGSGSVGGFIGSAEGGNSQYAECEAHGSAKGTGNGVGGFAGQTTGGGTRYSECRALGSAATTSNRAGGFAGNVSGANAFWRCFSAGSATASHEVGGFLGYNNGGGTTATECFALGDATATRTGNDAIAGGFIGYGYYGAGFTDCYCLGTVKGERVVGGFAGYLYDSGNTFTRCYAAGALECSGTWAGAFVGYPRNYGAITDCAALCTGDLHAFGTGTAGTSEAKENIAEYDAAGMKNEDNFGTWLLVDDEDGSVWRQVDGVTQPYLAWSSPDGDLTVYASIGGSASGRIDGATAGGTVYWCEPGKDTTVTAIPDDGGFFVKWTGSTPYASRTSASTTIKMDNHRVAAALLGKLITTPDELDAVRNDLAGIYGLGNDIDLADRDWTPLGNDSTRFSGSFFGFGHAVKNLTCTNGTTTSYTTNYRGLFGCTSGATLDDIKIANCDVAGYQYVGALVGRIYEGTSISGCSASGKVRANSGYAGGLVGAGDSCTFTIRNSSAAVETTGGNNVGGFIGRIYSSGTPDISGCRADGFVSGTGSVGGFVGNVSAPARISGCAARGDVKSTGNDFGGFIGNLGNTSATNANCWASGAVWGTGSNCGSFLGNWYYSRGTVENCAVSASANGARWFCGSNVALTGDRLSDRAVAQRSEGWPEVEPRWKSATPITTAEQLFDVTNHLDGRYYLAATTIDLGGAAWTPIGNNSTGFTGEFYGNNHCISNFVVNAGQCAGLFGNIAGGRIEGVRAFGTVTGTSDQAGGFAGRICSRSLVAENAFVGAVSSSSTKVGGFAGYIYDQPSVFECCAVGTVTKTGSGGNYDYVGGFVGHHKDGYVADSYAQVAVVAGSSGRVGGFTGQTEGGKIARTYCSGSVGSTSTTYVGAFGGNLTANIVTNSYYNSSATSQSAAGKNGSAAAGYAGIDPVAAADMTARGSFPAFDFDETWQIQEGKTFPYLLCFASTNVTCYADWLVRYSLPEGASPTEVRNGIPLAARYLFDIPPAETAPVCQIRIDGSGAPWLEFPEEKYNNDIRATFWVLESPDLVNWTVVGDLPVNLETGVFDPGYDPIPDHMFFKYKIVIDD